MIQPRILAYAVSGYLAGNGLVGIRFPQEARDQLATPQLKLPKELRQRVLELAEEMVRKAKLICL